MTAEEAKTYRGQIVMNTEEEVFYPALTVGQTMDFASRLKVPFQLPTGVNSHEELRVQSRDFLLKSMGIEHTIDTKVGDAFVRGCSRVHQSHPRHDRCDGPRFHCHPLPSRQWYL
ncbi:hypothetical protein LB505_001509 [Fusarium chuoi]|nr:hypothetical protein LB505_001509 [Fusarium chuoi]